jgi:hypothetical protein
VPKPDQHSSFAASIVDRWVTTAFAFDSRALRVFYVALALLVVADCWLKLQIVDVAYSEHGLYPTSVATKYWGERTLNPLMVNIAGPNWSVMVLWIYGVCGFLSGVTVRRCRWAIGAYVALALLHLRNHVVLDGADRFLICILFWSSLLPNAGWKSRGLTQSWGNVGYAFQWVFVYLFTGLWKYGDTWRIEFTAVERSLNLTTVAKDNAFTQWLLDHPGVCQFLTVGVLGLELLGPCLMLTGSRRIRNALVLSFIGLHTGLFLCFSIRLFSLVGMVAVLPFWSFRNNGDRNTRAMEEDSDWRFAVVVSLGVYLGWLNILSFDPFRNSRMFRPTMDRSNLIGNVMGLSQKWAMFAPDPASTESLFVVEHREADKSWQPVADDRSVVEQEAMNSLLRFWSTTQNAKKNDVLTEFYAGTSIDTSLRLIAYERSTVKGKKSFIASTLWESAKPH